MKRIVLGLALVSMTMANAQDLNDIFVSGVADAERFANAYLSPVSEGTLYSISTGWYNTADAKPLGGLHSLWEACRALGRLAEPLGGLQSLWEACRALGRLAEPLGGLQSLWEACKALGRLA